MMFNMNPAAEHLTLQHDVLLIIHVLCNLYVFLGTKVIQVMATDADDPTTANGELRYSLIQDFSAFQIDSLSGELTALTSNMILSYSNIVFCLP